MGNAGRGKQPPRIASVIYLGLACLVILGACPAAWLWLNWDDMLPNRPDQLGNYFHVSLPPDASVLAKWHPPLIPALALDLKKHAIVEFPRSELSCLIESPSIAGLVSSDSRLVHDYSVKGEEKWRPDEAVSFLSAETPSSGTSQTRLLIDLDEGELVTVYLIR